MRRWFMGWLLGLGGNALGLLLASLIVSGFSIDGVTGFLVSLVVLLKVPLGHGEHVVALNRYRPGMQGRQKACSSSGWC